MNDEREIEKSGQSRKSICMQIFMTVVWPVRGQIENPCWNNEALHKSVAYHHRIDMPIGEREGEKGVDRASK